MNVNHFRIYMLALLGEFALLHMERKVIAIQNDAAEAVLMLRYKLNNFIYDLVLANDFDETDSLEAALFVKNMQHIAPEDLEISLSLMFKDGTHVNLS